MDTSNLIPNEFNSKTVSLKCLLDSLESVEKMHGCYRACNSFKASVAFIEWKIYF